jgi:hypothetical protein
LARSLKSNYRLGFRAAEAKILSEPVQSDKRVEVGESNESTVFTEMAGGFPVRGAAGIDSATG